MRRLVLLASLVGVAAFTVATTAEAACTKIDGVTVCHRYKASHPGTRVKGFVTRRGGGYSYSFAESINTYGDTGSRYPSNLKFRDPSFDRQTDGGPFDNGFFFDSGIRPHGGDSPYMN